MVDKRNASGSQNDVRYDSNDFVQGGGNPNASNSYKLGDSVKSAVSDSDKAWAEKQREQHSKQISECEKILADGSDEAIAHAQNEVDYNTASTELESTKESIEITGADGKKTVVEYTEDQLVEEIKKYQALVDGFANLKRKIVNWVNEKLIGYQNQCTTIYMSNDCVKKIYSYSATEINSKKGDIEKALEETYGSYFRDDYLFGLAPNPAKSYYDKVIDLYNIVITYKTLDENSVKHSITDDGKSFILDETGKKDARSPIRSSLLLNKFGEDLHTYGLCDDQKTAVNEGVKVHVLYSKTLPEWVAKVKTHLVPFAKSSDDYGGNGDGETPNFQIMLKDLMSAQCNIDSSFYERDGTDTFTSDVVKENQNMLDKYNTALTNIRTRLYGIDEDGEPRDKNNPDPNAVYGKYVDAKEKYENDDYSQAEKTMAMAQSGATEMSVLLGDNSYVPPIPPYGDSDGDSDYGDFDSGDSDSDPSDGSPSDEGGNDVPITNDSQGGDAKSTAPLITPQTVLDMLGFINGMKKITRDYPYLIQGISGLDAAYNKNYGIKDPYLGSGDDKITLTCLESLDLRVSSMFNRYFNAVYDRQYRRERVPLNLRRFNCIIYVHDVRNFAMNMMSRISDNKVIELTNMYHSAIEFRFYDCEIVPEETGNIFNDVTNEAPTEMKKTNFSFTYGNCIVNFIPTSMVGAHKK
jgi:hypothetical protein